MAAKTRMLKFFLMYLPLLLAGSCYGQTSALTPEQKQVLQQKMQALESSARAQTDRQNAKIAEIAKNIDRNLLSGKPDEALDRKLSADFAAEVASMVNGAIETKLAATREMVKVLTPDQKAALLAELEKPGANPDMTELIKALVK
jgi:Spy/CpxP family protein refolding chaperone